MDGAFVAWIGEAFMGEAFMNLMGGAVLAKWPIDSVLKYVQDDSHFVCKMLSTDAVASKTHFGIS